MDDLIVSGLRIDWNMLTDSYVSRIPSLRSIDELEFHKNVTFLVGENGSGKSTLLEGIAVACGFNAEGGTRNYRFSTYDDTSDLAKAMNGARRVAVLENVVDATNIGAIFRSAAALGMDAVLLTSTCCDPLTRRAVRVSMGTVFQIPWAVLDDWSLLHRAGFSTCAMALRDDSIALGDGRLSDLPKLAIVLGAEGDGLAASTIAACDYTVRIPMGHGVDSLNVAAASAVAFWELRFRKT